MTFHDFIVCFDFIVHAATLGFVAYLAYCVSKGKSLLNCHQNIENISCNLFRLNTETTHVDNVNHPPESDGCECDICGGKKDEENTTKHS